MIEAIVDTCRLAISFGARRSGGGSDDDIHPAPAYLITCTRRAISQSGNGKGRTLTADGSELPWAGH